MQIGAMNHPGRDPLEEIAWIGRHAFDFVDFTFEPPAAAPDDVDADAVKRALAEHRLGVVAHTAYYLPLASPFASVRQAALAEFRRSLAAADRIGARVMNVHWGKTPGFFAAEQVIGWHAEVLQPLCEEAAERGITVALEHVPLAGPDQLERIESLLGRVPALRFHLDSGHAKLERTYDRWDDYLERLGPRLVHVHLSENDGTADQHLPLGAAPRNPTDWPAHIRKLKAAGYDATITLEVFAPAREHLLQSRDLLRRWWAEA